MIHDVVVTVPARFGLAAWIAEGDAAGEPWSGREWCFWSGGRYPKCAAGDRVYVVGAGRVRGYAPLVRIETGGKRWAFVRHGGAVAVTIPHVVPGFRGWRYRWWGRGIEVPFPDWRVASAGMPAVRDAERAS